MKIGDIVPWIVSHEPEPLRNDSWFNESLSTVVFMGLLRIACAPLSDWAIFQVLSFIYEKWLDNNRWEDGKDFYQRLIASIVVLAILEIPTNILITLALLLCFVVIMGGIALWRFVKKERPQ